MIALTTDQFAALDDDVRTAFARELTRQLSGEYPDLFASLPPGLAQRIVARKIDYAQEQYDIEFQSTLTTYLHYCCAIGALFDLQPDIHAVLTDLSLFPDDIPDLLPERVADKAWAQAERSATRRDWLVDEQLGTNDRVAARFCWALPQRADTLMTDAGLSAFITQSIATATEWHIEDETGQVAFAVCQTLLGEDFYNRRSKPWVPPVFHDPEILPMLRGVTLAGCTELEWGLTL